jgi:uncharacterized protein YjbI with pentapeptide repeats
VPVREDDLADVRTLLIGSEPLADPPLAPAHYRKILQEFEADPLGRDKLFTPEMKAEIAAAKQDGQEAKKPPGQAVAEILRSATASQSAEVKATAEQAIGRVDAGLARLDALKAANANAPPPAIPPASDQIRQLLGQVRALRDRLAASGAPPERIADADRLLSHPEVVALAKPPRPEVEPGPGADLSERDLSGQDLRGRDLSRANLQGARLLKTRLAGARLAGANLRMATLAEADLEGADLSGADLTKAAFFGANLKSADLTKSLLHGAVFEGADLPDATLDEARGTKVVFGRAKLRGVHARRAELTHAISIQGDLQGADLQGATLLGCSFTLANARGIQLAGATIYGTVFSQTDLSKADAVEIQGERTVWRGATLDGADLRWSNLLDARFDEASARGTDLSACNLRGASFCRATLDRAQLVEANLFGANLAKASLTSTSFQGANLYSAILLDAAGEKTVFARANLGHEQRRGHRAGGRRHDRAVLAGEHAGCGPRSAGAVGPRARRGVVRCAGPGRYPPRRRSRGLRGDPALRIRSSLRSAPRHRATPRGGNGVARHRLAWQPGW